MKRFLFLILLASFNSFSVVSYYGEERDESLMKARNTLSSLPKFTNRIKKSWNIECFEGNKESQKYLANFIAETLYNGLKRLEVFNPILVHTKLSKVIDKKLRITCENQSGSLGYYRRGFPFITQKLSLSSGIFKLFSNIQEFEFTDNALQIIPGDIKGSIKEYDLDTLLKRKRYDASFNSSAIYHPNKIRYVIFHEYLHLLGFDNVSTLKHNNGHKVDYAEKDVVYACAAQAYPHLHLNISLNNKKEVGFFANTVKACINCFLAKSSKRGTTIIKEISKINEAREFCEDKKANKPYEFDYSIKSEMNFFLKFGYHGDEEIESY